MPQPEPVTFTGEIIEHRGKQLRVRLEDGRVVWAVFGRSHPNPVDMAIGMRLEVSFRANPNRPVFIRKWLGSDAE